MADIRTEPPQLTLMKLMQKLAELRFTRSRLETRQAEISYELTVIDESILASDKAIAEQESQISSLKQQIKEDK